MTEKLFNFDSHMRSFTANVVSCKQEGADYAVELNHTAFFPGGGGQAYDQGTIAGFPVLDMREEGETILHILPATLECHSSVDCELDWETRFSRMQSHSGEHIVSGTVHRLFGFENVGFHMGENVMTLDFSGELSADELDTVEREANSAVWENLPIFATVPDSETLSAMEYRSKKALNGDVRIVEIPGVDACACCAPHVNRTGEIGAIKILDSMRHRGGTRLSLICGDAAISDYMALHKNAAAISNALSAKRLDISDSVLRVVAELEAQKQEIVSLRRELLAFKIAALGKTDDNLCLFEPDMDMISLRELVNAGMECATGMCAAFSGADGEYKYIIGSKSCNLRQMSREINAAISGKGGGSETMIQGTARATRAEIEVYFKA